MRERVRSGASLPLIPAKSDVIILGKRIPAGTTIIFPTVTGVEDLHNPIFAVPGAETDNARAANDILSSLREPTAVRRVGYWEPDTGHLFQPERWIKDGRFDINAGPSLPFSLGQRACFGKNLAVGNCRVLALIDSCLNFVCSFAN